MPQPHKQEGHRKPGHPGDRVAVGAGLGLLVPSAIGGHQVVQSARRKTGAAAHTFQSTDIMRLKGASRAKHAAGWAASRGLGGVGLGVTSAGLYGMTRRKSRKKVGDLSPSEKLRAVEEAAHPVRTKHRARDIAVTGGSGLVGQGVASELVNRKWGKVTPTKFPHWGRAVGSSLGAVGGLTGGREIMRRLQQHDRKVAGQRVSKAERITEESERKRLLNNRLQVRAAGQIPVVGDPIAAARAAQLAPPEHRKRAFGTVLGSQWGASAAGTLGGAYLGHKVASKVPAAQKGSEKLERGVEHVKAHANIKARKLLGMEGPVQGPKPAPKAARGLGKLIERSKLKTPAGFAGSLIGGTALVNTIPPSAYKRYQRKYEMRTPTHATSRKVSKAVQPNKPLTTEEQERLRRGKRRQARISYALAGMGAGATGLLLAGKGKSAVHTAQLKRAGTYVKPDLTPGQRLTNAATNISIGSGGVGTLSSLQFARNQKLESRQKVSKTGGIPRPVRQLGGAGSGVQWHQWEPDMVQYYDPMHLGSGRRLIPMKRSARQFEREMAHASRRYHGESHDRALADAGDRKRKAWARMQEVPTLPPPTRVRKAKDRGWADPNYQILGDPLYEKETGMRRVHRGTYPPVSFMAEYGIGVTPKGEVYMGRRHLRQPVNRWKAERASEHAATAREYQAKEKQAQRKQKYAAYGATGGTMAGALVGMKFPGKKMYTSVAPAVARSMAPMFVGSFAGAAGGHLLGRTNDAERRSWKRKEGRYVRHGQNALVGAAVPMPVPRGRVEKGFAIPRVPRAVPVGAGRSRSHVAGFTMRRRNPMTGVTRVSTVRGGVR